MDFYRNSIFAVSPIDHLLLCEHVDTVERLNVAVRMELTMGAGLTKGPI